MTNIELHCIQKPPTRTVANTNSADVKRDTLLQFHTIILNELPQEYVLVRPGSVRPNRHELKAVGGGGGYAII